MIIIITEDDLGHATLIKRNLKRVGITNTIMHFKDGQEVLDFLLQKGNGPHRVPHTPYLMLLDIRMPKVDGIEVLRQVKENTELRKIPVIIITTTDNPHEIEKCHSIGCSSYITKPIDYDKFIEAINQLGLFLMVVKVPNIYEEEIK